MKKNFKKLRHRWEMPLVWFSALSTFVLIFLGALLLNLDDTSLKEIFGEDAESIKEVAETTTLIVIFPVSMFIYRFYLAAKAKSNGILVGPNQFPELWEMYKNLGEKLEMKVLPKLYVTNGNGVVNAYALSCNTRVKYVVVHSEIVVTMAKSPNIVEFVLAHELAHHKLNHVSLWRIVLAAATNILKPLGVSTVRAQEYSADRLAFSICCHHTDAMSLLALGPWMHQEVDANAWLEQCEVEHKELFVRIVNLMSDHAVLVKRYKALREIEEGGFKQHGEMF